MEQEVFRLGYAHYLRALRERERQLVHHNTQLQHKRQEHALDVISAFLPLVCYGTIVNRFGKKDLSARQQIAQHDMDLEVGCAQHQSSGMALGVAVTT